MKDVLVKKLNYFREKMIEIADDMELIENELEEGIINAKSEPASNYIFETEEYLECLEDALDSFKRKGGF